MENIKSDSSFKILFILALLYKGSYSKEDIIQEFKKNNETIAKTTVAKYIKKIKENNILIAEKTVGNNKYYSIKKDINVELNNDEIRTSQDVKKLFISEKNPENIRKMMRIFYKFAMFCEDDDTKEKLADFEYYSKINWLLIKQLKKHCAKKDIITIDYLTSSGTHNYITIHVDMIKSGNWSEKLYLVGVLAGKNEFSRLRADKILMIKKVEKENVRFDFETDCLTYKVLKEIYENSEPDELETITEIKDGLAVIKRPIDDSFYLIQRLLYFCPDLYYISNERIKNLVKEKLNILKDTYDVK